MKKIYILIILIIVALNVDAQTFQWAKKITANGLAYDENGASITTDASGNVYTTGFLNAGGVGGTADLDPGPGVFTVSVDRIDVFVSKLDAAGNFVWGKIMGGILDDKGISIKVDGSGNVYTIGSFNGTADFDPGPGTFTLTANNSAFESTFISKLDASGNFVWARTFGGSARGVSIAIDATGNVYTTGWFIGTSDFDPGPGTATVISQAGSRDCFISKLDASGNFVWVKTFGNNANDGATSVALDASANIYTTGSFSNSVDFDPGAGTFSLTASTPSANSAFISKLDAAGNFIWAKTISGNSSSDGVNIAVDLSGNVYANGSFQGVGDFDPGTGTYTLSSASFGYALYTWKLDASGNLVWAKQIGGIFPSDLALDPSGNVYITGNFAYLPTDFDPGPATYTLTNIGIFIGAHVYVFKWDASGNFVWAAQFGGTIDQFGHGISADATGNVCVTGSYNGQNIDFDPGPGSFNLPSTVGAYNVFVLKWNGGLPVNVHENSLSNNMIIYPNPNTGSFKLQIDQAIDNGEIFIFNALGQKVFERKIIQGTNEINVTGFSKGIYNCVFQNANQKSAVTKLAIE